MTAGHTCRVCGIALTKYIIYASCVDKHDWICKTCKLESAKSVTENARRQANPYRSVAELIRDTEEARVKTILTMLVGDKVTGSARIKAILYLLQSSTYLAPHKLDRVVSIANETINSSETPSPMAIKLAVDMRGLMANGKKTSGGEQSYEDIITKPSDIEPENVEPEDIKPEDNVELEVFI